MQGPVHPTKIPGELGVVLNELTAYKTGKVYMEFESAADLLFKIDRVVQDYLNTAMIRYARDAVAREPSSESEEWLLASYRKRSELTQRALARGCRRPRHEEHGAGDGQAPSTYLPPLRTGRVRRRGGRKFVAYVFDDEPQGRRRKSLGRLAIIGASGLLPTDKFAVTLAMLRRAKYSRVHGVLRR
jgi:hypothetical protein